MRCRRRRGFWSTVEVGLAPGTGLGQWTVDGGVYGQREPMGSGRGARDDNVDGPERAAMALEAKEDGVHEGLDVDCAVPERHGRLASWVVDLSLGTPLSPRSPPDASPCRGRVFPRRAPVAAVGRRQSSE